MGIERDSSFQRAIDSALFIRLSRLAIVAATGVGLPLAGFGLHAVYERASAIAQITEQTRSRLELLDQAVRLTFDQREKELTRIEAQQRDHEERLRAVEKVVVRRP